MKILAAYELTSGKEQCIGTWDTVAECAKSLGLTASGVYSRIFRGKSLRPRRSQNRREKYYLRRVEIDEIKGDEYVS